MSLPNSPRSRLLRRLLTRLQNCCRWAAPSTAARCAIEPAASASVSRGCLPREQQIPTLTRATPAVVIGLDGGYLRSRHPRPERNFEVIAGKVFNLDGSQHRFAFARNGNSVIEFS